MPLEMTMNGLGARALVDYTRPGLIVPRLREHDTAGIISELSQALHREGIVPDVLPFYHAALNQELLGNSAIECGLAFPHARLGGAKQLQFAFGRASEPVSWGAKGGRLVQLIFLLAVPATDAARYLHLLGTLARLGQQPECLAALRAAETEEAVLNVLGRFRMREG